MCVCNIIYLFTKFSEMKMNASFSFFFRVFLAYSDPVKYKSQINSVGISLGCIKIILDLSET